METGYRGYLLTAATTSWSRTSRVSRPSTKPGEVEKLTADNPEQLARCKTCGRVRMAADRYRAGPRARQGVNNGQGDLDALGAWSLRWRQRALRRDAPDLTTRLPLKSSLTEREVAALRPPPTADGAVARTILALGLARSWPWCDDGHRDAGRLARRSARRLPMAISSTDAAPGRDEVGVAAAAFDEMAVDSKHHRAESDDSGDGGRVSGLDHDARVTFANRPATEALGQPARRPARPGRSATDSNSLYRRQSDAADGTAARPAASAAAPDLIDGP